MNIIIEEPEKSKKTVNDQEWMEKLESIKIFRQETNRLIMNFFLIEGTQKSLYINKVFTNRL